MSIMRNKHHGSTLRQILKKRLCREAYRRKKAEHELRECKNQLKNLKDSLPMGVAVVDAETRIIMDVNPAAAEMLRTTRDHLVGRLCHECLCPANMVRCPVNHLGQIDSTSGRMQLKTGNETLHIVKKVSTVQLRGRTHYVEFITDHTNIKDLEKRLRVSEKMETIGLLTSGVIHDFNNLLTVIIGYSDLLASEMKDEFRHYKLANEILKAGNRASQLTKQLLVYSRNQDDHPTVLNINTNLMNIHSMLKRLIGDGIEISLNLTHNLNPVKASTSQIDQIIMNLVINARDSISYAGKIALHTHNYYAPEYDPLVSNDKLKPGEYVVIEVADNGCGMNDEVLGRLFEPFFTTKPEDKGTGLGLFTVMGLARNMNGIVKVQSNPGMGSTFKVYLPASENPCQTFLPNQLLNITGKSETVLIVEDDVHLLELNSLLLSSNGYKVLSASSPNDAINIVDNYTEPIQLILTDIVMPAMKGTDLALLTKTKRPEIKVLLTTGYFDAHLLDEVKPESNFMLLLKPYHSRELLCLIREILEK